MKYLNLIILALLSANSINTFANEHSMWSYEGSGAPSNWGKLSPDFNQCGAGVNQSPINITAPLNAHLMPLHLQFSDTSFTEINNGHTIQISDISANTLTLDNDLFSLQQFHFHTPSENTFDGKHFPLEAHFVYKNKEGDIAVVAVMYRSGDENIGLKTLWQNMPIKLGGKATVKQKLNLENLFPSDFSYYRFSGSLTTPPCTEGVRWLVLKHPMTISEQQMEKFTNMMHHHNNRPLQPLDGRVIVE